MNVDENGIEIPAVDTQPTPPVDNPPDVKEGEGDGLESAGVKGVPAPGNTPLEVPNVEAVGEILTEKGVDFEALSTEYSKEGQLSSKTYESLAGAGFPKEVVDSYIFGVETKANAFNNAVYDTAGGEAKYGEVVAFVQSQGDAAIDAFNAAIQSSNMSLIKSHVDGVNAQMVAKRGTSNPSLLGSTGVTVVGSFNSMDEMTAAMSDPRYGRNEAYTTEVRNKVKTSPNLFTSK